MSFLRMSSVGVLPGDEKLKRGEVLLQYTRVLAPPDYSPIPFNKQQVRHDDRRTDSAQPRKRGHCDCALRSRAASACA